ncbi:MAG: glycosyltransferase family 4 protein, partial [Muribaculaceae bacterium]|nr:glycosyltransferase family 4 protein [Muribaculaceae bacterium]
YMTHLGRGLARRAPQLKRDHDIVFRFVVPKDYAGCFGSDVEYMEMATIQRHFTRWNREWQSDIFHTPTQFCAFKSMPRAGHRLMTIHDINFVYTKSGIRLKRAHARLQRRLRKADSLVYITDFARADVNRHFTVDQPSTVVYNGITDPIADPVVSEEFRSALPDGYLLHLSNLQVNKNVDLLVDMMELMPDRHLVIAGNWSRRPELKARVGAMPNITALDRVSEDEKWWLYRNCRAFLFPSACEGFGMPPIEAMKSGKPVFLSTLTSLPEVGGKDAFYWPQLTPEAMTEVLDRSLAAAAADPGLPSRLKAHASQFTWDACTDAYIDLYLRILDSGSASTHN